MLLGHRLNVIGISTILIYSFYQKKVKTDQRVIECLCMYIMFFLFSWPVILGISPLIISVIGESNFRPNKIC
jgi:hypothetical protein